MAHYNVEIKARCEDPDHVREALRRHGADFRGVDRQVDTYFNCPDGRLKLRLGDIERALIFYKRPDRSGPKASEVVLHLLEEDNGKSLLATLTAALGVKVRVEKTREIYFVANVKIHLDLVPGLGEFVEIEAMDNDQALGMDAIRRQCEQFMSEFNISPEDLIDRSYSDMLIVK